MDLANLTVWMANSRVGERTRARTPTRVLWDWREGGGRRREEEEEEEEGWLAAWHVVTSLLLLLLLLPPPPLPPLLTCSFSKIGMRKAAVFPEPVLAIHTFDDGDDDDDDDDDDDRRGSW